MSKYIDKDLVIQTISKCHYISDAMAAVRLMDESLGTCAGCWHYTNGDITCYHCARFYKDQYTDWEAD